MRRTLIITILNTEAGVFLVMSNWIIIALFIAGGLILQQIANAIFKILEKKNRSMHIRFFKSLVNVVIAILTIYALAQQFDVTKGLSTALLQSGTLLIAIATFAAQQALSNVISGFSLSFSKPYSVNDKIKVVQGGSVAAEGIVTDITLRHTIISQYNGESCIVPNSVMDSAVITNTNFTENIGNFMEIEISYDSDIRKALEIMKTICSNNPLTINTMQNSAFVKGYSMNGIILKTTVWTKTLDDSYQACSEIRITLIEEFKKAQIEVPYQTVTVYTESGNRTAEAMEDNRQDGTKDAAKDDRNYDGKDTAKDDRKDDGKDTAKDRGKEDVEDRVREGTKEDLARH